MSLTYASKKRKRIYIRKFDHDVARQMRAGGQSLSAIARQLGVTPVAVKRVCDITTKIRMEESTERFIRCHREPCADCGRLLGLSPRKTVKPGEKVIPYKTRTGYCQDCWNKRRVADRVRETELLCSQCGEWKPDAAFSPTPNGKYRRWRKAECRTCSDQRRKDYRSKTYEHEQQVWKARYRKATANGR